MTETEIQVKPLTEAYLMSLEAQGLRFEVTDGEIVYQQEEDEYVTGEEHGRIAFKLMVLMGAHVLAQRLGILYPGDTDFILNGGEGDIQVQRKPDVAFVRAENVTPTPGYIYRAPDLAIEIISPSQTFSEIKRKAEEYFHYGTAQVWIVEPATQSIFVWNADGMTYNYEVGDTLTSDLLPGLTLDVAAIFAL